MTALATRPPAVAGIRLLIALQAAIGVCVVALSGTALIYIVLVALNIGPSAFDPRLTAALLWLIGGAVLSLVLLGSLGRLRSNDPAGRRIVLVVEVLLCVVVAGFLFSASSTSMLVWVPAGIDLLCALDVVVLLHTPAVRRWCAGA